MKKSKRNFVDSYIPRAIALGLFSLACVSGVAYAASDNGCGISNNSYINPEIALCSTHVYNIRQTHNPKDAASKQAMRDVIALKTTLMTQQLEQQYDFLEATVSRLKTQLQKAVLTTNLEAAGASSSSSSSSSSVSSDRNVVLIGAENCFLKSTPSDGLNCIQSNVRIVLQAVSAGNIGEAYRQLQKDIEFAKSFGAINADSLKENGAAASCNETTLRAQRDSVNQCAYQLNIAVMNAIDSRNKAQQQNNQQFRY